MHFLITGGAGFIGSHLVSKLTKMGHEVLIVDDLSTGHENNVPKHIKLIKKRVQNISIKGFENIDGIFHLGAQTSVPLSINNMYESSSNNLKSTLKVFDLARKYDVPVVYASSSAVYGNMNLGDDTIDKFDILSPYAQDKITMEKYAFMMKTVYGIGSLGLRFFNVYGPRQDPSSPYSGVISIFIDRLSKNEKVIVYGGQQTRDFVFVKDVADCLIMSMDIVLKNNICDVVNVGTGISTSIDDLLEQLFLLFQNRTDIVRRERQTGDPLRSGGAYEKLKAILNIDPNTFTNLKDGLERTIRYIQNEKI